MKQKKNRKQKQEERDVAAIDTWQFREREVHLAV